MSLLTVKLSDTALKPWVIATRPLRRFKKDFRKGRTAIQTGRVGDFLHITKADFNRKKAETVLRMLPERDIVAELTGDESPMNPANTAFFKALDGQGLSKFEQKAFDAAIKPWLARQR